MHVPTRLSVAFALLIALLLALTALAVGNLRSLGMGSVGIAAGCAGLAAVGAVVIAYRVLREGVSGPAESEIEAAPEPAPRVPAQDKRATIQPEQVPPEYLAAVLRGAQIRHAAYRRAESSQSVNG